MKRLDIGLPGMGLGVMEAVRGKLDLNLEENVTFAGFDIGG